MSDAGADATPQSLVRMANQIASHAEHKPHDVAVETVAAHLVDFWAPSMRSTLITYVDAGGAGLTPLARDAVDRLR